MSWRRVRCGQRPQTAPPRRTHRAAPRRSSPVRRCLSAAEGQYYHTTACGASPGSRDYRATFALHEGARAMVRRAAHPACNICKKWIRLESSRAAYSSAGGCVRRRPPEDKDERRAHRPPPPPADDADGSPRASPFEIGARNRAASVLGAPAAVSGGAAPASARPPAVHFVHALPHAPLSRCLAGTTLVWAAFFLHFPTHSLPLTRLRAA